MIHHAPSHPKFKRLVRRLRPLLDGTAVAPETVAVGILERLWHATIVGAYKGDIGRLDDEDIAEAIGWAGEPSEIIDLLVECGWLDRHDEYRLVVHDWHQHAPRFVRANAARHGGFAGASLEEPSPGETLSGTSPGEPPPNPTQPDQTEPDLTVGSTSTSTSGATRKIGEVKAPAPDPVAAARLIRRVGPCRSARDLQLAWKLVGAAGVISENWLADGVEAVRQVRPAKPWGYLWTTLENGATEAGHNLGAVLRGIPPPPEGWRPGLDERLEPLPDFSERAVSVDRPAPPRTLATA